MNCLGYALALGIVGAIFIQHYTVPTTTGIPYFKEICDSAMLLTLTNIYIKTHKKVLGEYPKK